MKRSVKRESLDVRLRTIHIPLISRAPLFSLLLVVSGSLAVAMTADNPYGQIIERNAFALKDPPPPPPVLTAPTAPASNIEFRGISTLFGRPQALLNFKVPGKPPEPPKERSLVMDIGQREGDVEVLAVDPASGSVRLKNQGNEVTMNLKDNAPKPQFAASAGIPAVPGLPGVPPAPPNPAGGIPAPAAGGSSTTTIGGASGAAPSARPSLPSRNLRSGSTSLGNASGATVANDSRSLPLDAQMALIEIERERTRDAVSAGNMPPIPSILPK